MRNENETENLPQPIERTATAQAIHSDTSLDVLIRAGSLSGHQSDNMQYELQIGAQDIPLPKSTIASSEIDSASFNSITASSLFLPENVPSPESRNSADGGRDAQTGAGQSQRHAARSFRGSYTSQDSEGRTERTELSDDGASWHADRNNAPNNSLFGYPTASTSMTPLMYRLRLSDLAKKLPRLAMLSPQNVRHPKTGKIAVYDYYGVGYLDQKVVHSSTINIAEIHRQAGDFVDMLLERPDGDIFQRLILVEDLSAGLIEQLGAGFRVNPEFFADHLGSSAGFGNGKEDAINYPLWDNIPTTRRHATLSWFRPVTPLRDLKVTDSFRKELLNDSRVPVRCLQADCRAPADQQSAPKHPMRTVHNIFRTPWKISPEPSAADPSHPIGWNERVTMWTKFYQGCTYIIMLLDPLPLIQPLKETSRGRTMNPKADVPDWMDGVAEPQATQPMPPPPPVPISQHNGVSEEAIRPRLSPKAMNASSDIRLQSINAESVKDTVTQDIPVPNVTSHPASAHRAGAAQAFSQPAHPILASLQPQDDSARAQSVVLHQPSITDEHAASQRVSSEGAEDSTPTRGLRKRLTRQQTMKQRETGKKLRMEELVRTRPLLATLVPGVPRVPAEPLFVPVMVVVQAHEPFTPFSQFKPRGESTVSDEDLLTASNINMTIDRLQRPMSTLDEIVAWTSESNLNPNIYDPLTLLIRSIHIDTIYMIEIITSAISTIRDGRNDEVLLQERVTYWRSMLNQYRQNLRGVEEQLEDFTRLLYANTDATRTDFDHFKDNMPPTPRRLVEDALSRLRQMGGIIESSYETIRAELQILDSRRSIAEAESVSKITELAFVFIPLTFAASLFSMQIRELGSDGVPAYIFVLVSLAFLMLAYSVRLMIRNKQVHDFKQRIFSRARKHAKLEKNDPIPTHKFLKWLIPVIMERILSTIWMITKFSFGPAIGLGVIVAFLSPIIALWRRNMNSGLSAMITVVILLLDAIALYPIAKAITEMEQYEWSPAKIYRVRDQNRKSRIVHIEERMINEPIFMPRHDGASDESSRGFFRSRFGLMTRSNESITTMSEP